MSEHRDARVAGEQAEKLRRWIDMQKGMIEFIEELRERLDSMDRLEALVYSRLLFQHLEKTVHAFDEWLQDPLIATIIPEQEMKRVLSTLLEAARAILELDVTHTERVRTLLEEASAQGEHPLLRRSRGRLEGRGSLSI